MSEKRHPVRAPRGFLAKETPEGRKPDLLRISRETLKEIDDDSPELFGQSAEQCDDPCDLAEHVLVGHGQPPFGYSVPDVRRDQVSGSSFGSPELNLELTERSGKFHRYAHISKLNSGLRIL